MRFAGTFLSFGRLFARRSLSGRSPSGHAFSRRSVRERLATPTGRFRLAVTAGFLVSAIGFTTIVVNDQDSIADTAWGLGSLFGMDQPAEPAPQQAQAAPSRGWGWIMPRRHAHVEARREVHREAARRRVAKVEQVRFMRSVEHTHSLSSTDGPAELGRRSVCVRLCDGFAFPVGTYHGEQDRAAHEATCQSECPGAATALYVVPSGSDTMDEAIRVGTDKNYSDLPYAFHYTTVLSNSCSCHPPEGNRIKSLLHDFTLRRGDAVMTSAGFKVFHGAARFPYRRTDFVKLEQSRDIRAKERATFREIERANLMSAPNIAANTAQTGPEKPAPVQPRVDRRAPAPGEPDAGELHPAAGGTAGPLRAASSASRSAIRASRLSIACMTRVASIFCGMCCGQLTS